MADLIRRGLKLSHLRLLAELSETGQLGIAAVRLGIAQPAASRLLAEAEAIVGHPLRQREGRGIALTTEGRALAARAGRILSEIRAAGREIAEGADGLTGQVRLGSVTGPALQLVLPALRAARVALPGITVEVEVTNTDQLGPMMRDGRLDFAICRMPEGFSERDFDLRLFGSEPVSLVVRRGHALDRPGPIPRHSLLEFDWILPGPGVILRQTVLDRLAGLGLPAPTGRLSTSSFLLTLAWLAQSNAIAPLSRPVARQFASVGEYAILAEDLDITIAPYGLLTRRDTALPPAAARICRMIVDLAGVPA